MKQRKSRLRLIYETCITDTSTTRHQNWQPCVNSCNKINRLDFTPDYASFFVTEWFKIRQITHRTLISVFLCKWNSLLTAGAVFLFAVFAIQHDYGLETLDFKKIRVQECLLPIYFSLWVCAPMYICNLFMLMKACNQDQSLVSSTLQNCVIINATQMFLNVYDAILLLFYKRME